MCVITPELLRGLILCNFDKTPVCSGLLQNLYAYTIDNIVNLDCNLLINFGAILVGMLLNFRAIALHFKMLLFIKLTVFLLL